MKRYLIGTGIVGVLAAGALAFSGTAAAAPLGGEPADQVLNQLRADGYNVQLNLNSTRDVPFYQCLVTGVHGLPNSAPVGGSSATQFTTVYVDVNCPPNNG